MIQTLNRPVQKTGQESHRGMWARTGDVKVSESRLRPVEVGMQDSLTPGLHISY